MTTCGGTGTYLPNYIHSYLRGFDLKPKNSTSFLHQELVADILPCIFCFWFWYLKIIINSKFTTFENFIDDEFALLATNEKEAVPRFFRQESSKPPLQVQHLVQPKNCSAETIALIQTNHERYKRRNLHRLLKIAADLKDEELKLVFLIDNTGALGRFKHENRVFDDVLIGL